MNFNYLKLYMLVVLSCSLLMADNNEIYLKYSNDLIYMVDREYSTGLEIGVKYNNNTYKIGQDMYTPDNKSTPSPVNGERPYAGWLYAEIQHDYKIEKNDAFFSLAFGTIGERAKAKWVQTEFHQLINNDEIKGWDSQHKNQYGYILTLYNSYESLYSSIRLGGIDRSLELGFKDQKHISIWDRDYDLALSLSSKYVDKNIFLEDNGNGYGVKKRDYVYKLVLDFSTKIDSIYTLLLETTILSKEYTTQASPHGYATIKISKSF